MNTNDGNTENTATIMYAVASGDYSEFEICSLWTSKEAADAECKRLTDAHLGNDCRVQEYLLNTSKIDGGRREVEGFCARYEVSKENSSATVTAADVTVKRGTFFGEEEDRAGFYPTSRGHFAFYSNSATEETAVRLVLEAVSQLVTIDCSMKNPIPFSFTK